MIPSDWKTFRKNYKLKKLQELMFRQLTFITGNPNKAAQLGKYLEIPLLHRKIELEEIQSLSLEDVVKHKVSVAFEKVKTPVIVDDTSLVIKSLGNLPGPFIKYFLKELGNEKICQIVANFADKTAKAFVDIGYYDGKNLEIFQGEIEGIIADKPDGNNGFGWDTIFIPNGYNKTRAAMEEEEYDETSPRRIALEKFKKYLSL